MTEPVKVKVSIGLPDDEPERAHTQQRLDCPWGEWLPASQGTLFDLGEPVRRERPRLEQPELF